MPRLPPPDPNDIGDPRTFVMAYKKANPDATPGEVMQALQTSAAIMNPQKKFELEATKVQLGAMQKMMDLQEKYYATNKRSDTAVNIHMDSENRRDARAKLAAGEPLSSDDKASLGSQAATGEPLNQIASGYGKEAAKVKMLARGEAIRQISEETGLDPKGAGQELARRQAMYQADKASTTQLDKMLGATKQAVGQLDYNIKKAQADMAKLPSTNLSPILNALARGEQKWTGDPAYSALFFDMQAVANESARILNGGQGSVAQLSEGAREEAQKWANVGMTPDMFNAVAQNMLGEGQARLRTFQSAMEGQTPGRSQGAGQPAPDQGGGEASGPTATGPNGEKVQWDGSAWKPVK